MNEKKWTITLLSAVVITLIGFAGMMYWMDPLLHYGAESGPLTCYEYSEMYSNPGIAKHYEYDAVMVGTSMIQNTDVDLCDELWGCNMVRLPYSGGTTYNMKTILDICFESGNDIKTVYWELDQFQLTSSATEPRYPLPTYLYREDHKEDASYLLNLDVFYHYGVNDVIGTLKGVIQEAERRGITFDGDFRKAAMLANYNRPEISENTMEFEVSSMKTAVDANLNNIESLVKENTETEFVFYMVPFSVLYWDAQLRNGKFDAMMDASKYAMERLLKYDNVRIYFYQCEEDIITNLDNYKDFSHYGNWINDKITEYIAEDKNRITVENYQTVIQDMKDYIHAYDFETIFE